MKSLFTFLAFVITIQLAQAQFPGPGSDGQGRQRTATENNAVANPAPKGNAKITGYVIDSAATQAVEFANIALFNKATNKIVDGAVADDKGKFTMKGLAPGDYKIQISFVGFINKTIDGIKIKKGDDLDLGVLKLTPQTKMLQEVTVTGQKALIEEKVDRLVFNAEKDLTSKGGDASDVLKKVPMLTVDLDGNVSLRGSSNIRVLINNKPSTIMASSVADALKQIPADMIKTVEVITSPSAKYDAEGSGGIINIITKKTTLEGLTLNVDSGVGNRSSNLGLNGNYRKGKLGVSLSGFGRAFYNPSSGTLTQSTLQGGSTITTKQSTDAQDNGLFGQYTLGFDYDLAKNQSLSASARFGVRNFKRDQTQATSIFADEALKSTALRGINSQDLSNSVDLNIDYLHTFKPQQEWSISTQYSQNNLTNNFTSDLLGTGNDILSRQKNINLNTNKEFTVQTDYTTPLTKNQLLEFGVKGIFRQVNSNYEYLAATGNSSIYYNDATRPAGLLNYQQNVAAGYLSYTYTTDNKYTFKVGSRYEYTSITANDAKSTISIPDYSNLVPSINVSKTFAGTTLKAAYNRRIQRPGLQQLNPNFNAANPQDIRIGNPNLSPELTDNFELGASTNINKTYINASLFARQTNNSISQIRVLSDTLSGALITTFQNIGKQQNYGANVFANIFITPKWSLNGGVDLLHTYLEGQAQSLSGTSYTTSNSGFVVSGRIMTSLSLTNGWGIQGFGFFRGPQIQLQGSQSGFRMYSLGIKKDLPNQKGSIGIAAENFMTNGFVMATNLNSETFKQTSENKIYNSSVKLTFSYKIGKMSFSSPKKTKSVSNDDVKGDGGGDNSGGGQAAPASGGNSGNRPR